MLTLLKRIEKENEYRNRAFKDFWIGVYVDSNEREKFLVLGHLELIPRRAHYLNSLIA